MAYNKKALFQQAVKAIKEKNLFFIEDVVAYLPCDKTTFYRKFPLESNEYNELRALIDNNRVVTKTSIRKKLYDLDNPTALISLYRMIATPEERYAISMTAADITTKGEKISNDKVVIEVIDSRDKIDVSSAGDAEEDDL